VEHVSVDKELVVVCEWFRNNKMILKPEKGKALVLSKKPNLKLSLFSGGVALPVLDAVDLFELTLDNSLNFGKHITKISKKVGKQLDVLCRLKNIFSFWTKVSLYNSFIMSHFHYCSSIWHNCFKSDGKTLDRLHKRALRYLYSDESSQTSSPCDSIGYSLEDRRIQNLLIIVCKSINNYPPEYLRDLFRLRDNIKNLRGVNKLQVPKPNMTRYVKNSVRFLAATTWNKISDTLRSLTILSAFRKAVRELRF